jgi:hypothetical protein
MEGNFVKYKHGPSFVTEDFNNIDYCTLSLNSGMYKLWDATPFMGSVKYGFEPITLLDTLVRFQSGIVSEVLDKTSHFFSDYSTKVFKEMGICQKLGIAFHGPQGTGKTCTAQLVMLELISKYNAICIDATGLPLNFIKGALYKIRKFQPNLIVLFMDEAEIMLQREENNYLTFLDGTDSISDFVFIACTNYFNKIPVRIRKRKSRIKYAYEINCLPIEVYKEYIKDKAPRMSDANISAFAYLASEKPLTIDELKNALLDYRLDGLSIEEAIDNAKQYSKQETKMEAEGED